MPSPGSRPETAYAIAAAKAGLAVVQARVGASDVQLKGPSDLVTGTDIASQAAIERVLQEHDSTIAFVGEEGEQQLPDAGRYWLVDPLCGTANYAAGLPFYAVNIALVENGHASVGVVADGVTGEVYVAERGNGAWLLDGAELGVNRASRPLVTLEQSLPGPGQLRDFSTELVIRTLAERRLQVRLLWSTLGLAYLARGRLGGAVYVCDGPPVHFAAGLLIAEEAGAIVTNERGEPWHLFGPVYVAAANDEIHENLRRLSQSVVDELIAS